MSRLPEYFLLLYSLSGTLSIAVSQAAMALGAAVLLARPEQRRALAQVRTGLAAPLLAWTLAALLATAFSPEPVASAEKLKKIILTGMVFWPPAVVRSRWSLGRLYMALVFAAGVTSLYGVLTFFLQGGPALDARIRGFHGFYMTNSGLLLLCAFPALLLASCRSSAASHRWGAGIAGASMLAALLLGRLPGAWLGLAAGLAWLALVRARRTGAIALLGLAGALAISPAPIRDAAADLLDPDGPANRERLSVWRHGAELFARDPWTGFGLQDLRPEYARVKEPGDPPQGHMQSVPVQVAASMGLPGLLALGWLTVALLRALGAARAATKAGSFPRAVAEGAEGGLVAFLAAGVVEWNLGDSEILALLFFLVGTAIAAGRIAAGEGRG